MPRFLRLIADLADISQIAGFLEVIFRPNGGRCNEIRLAADCAGSQILGMTSSKRWNSSPGLHGTPLPSSSARICSLLTPQAGAGGARSPAVSDGMTAKVCRDTATLQIRENSEAARRNRSTAALAHKQRGDRPTPDCRGNHSALIAYRAHQAV